MDGQNWIEIDSRGRTCFVTGNAFMFFVDSFNSTAPQQGTLLHYKVT
jgi:hypothetical protein